MLVFRPTPANLKHVLRDNFGNYRLSDDRREWFKEFIGQGIFAAEGKDWLAQRKAASNIFTVRVSRSRRAGPIAHHLSSGKRSGCERDEQKGIGSEITCGSVFLSVAA